MCYTSCLVCDACRVLSTAITYGIAGAITIAQAALYTAMIISHDCCCYSTSAQLAWGGTSAAILVVHARSFQRQQAVNLYKRLELLMPHVMPCFQLLPCRLASAQTHEPHGVNLFDTGTSSHEAPCHEQ
jgi:hypothetical protein